MTAESCPLTILFADIGGSAALYRQEGDARAHQLVSHSLDCMKRAVETHRGRVLRTVGDSILASFEHVDEAWLGARAIQCAHRDLPLSVRVGFHHGPVIPDAGDVYGHAVNIAARVAEFARVGEIMATADAVSELSPTYQARVSAPGTIDVRGMPETLTVYRLQWDDEEPAVVTRVASSNEIVMADANDMRLRLSHDGEVLFAGPDREDVSLGRASDNDIRVVNDEASRHHAHLRYRHGQFLLQDESTNGTYVHKDSLMPFLVRRDSIVLDGRGVLSLGASPELPGADLILFDMQE